VTDADPDNPGHMLLIYDRVSLDLSTIVPTNPPNIPGWDSGNSWNREHTWPVSRGLGSESLPDGADLHNLRPSTQSVNSDRGNLNFGGEFGAQPFGDVNDHNEDLWYPGDADAGMVARQMFYMDVRYDGADSGTTDLTLVAGNPGTGGSQLGDLNRLIEWHFAAPPDSFERGRNQIIFDDYQHNRNPFVDRPEFVWSIFMNQTNDSQIAIDGAAVDGNGGSTIDVDLGRVYVGGAVPAAQSLTLNKAGNDGTYFEVTKSGDATSSLGGRLNAFRSSMADSKTIDVGLDTSTSTSGLKSGTVTIDNLDITTGGGSGHGANDANDVIDVTLAVLDHPLASFSSEVQQQELMIDFGIVPLGSGPAMLGSMITNLAGAKGPALAADLDLDAIQGIDDTDVLQMNLSTFSGLAQGASVSFDSKFTPNGVGQFAATYTLMLSDEDLPGEQMQSLTISLSAEAMLSGDYNRDGTVDAGDYTVWRDTMGQTVAAYAAADGDGSTMIDAADYEVWQDHFGVAAPSGAGATASHAVPEPAGVLLVLLGAMSGIVAFSRRRA